MIASALEICYVIISITNTEQDCKSYQLLMVTPPPLKGREYKSAQMFMAEKEQQKSEGPERTLKFLLVNYTLGREIITVVSQI